MYLHNCIAYVLQTYILSVVKLTPNSKTNDQKKTAQYKPISPRGSTKTHMTAVNLKQPALLHRRMIAKLDNGTRIYIA